MNRFDSASAVTVQARRLADRAAELQAMESVRVAEALCRAATGVARLSGQAAVDLRRALVNETGLSPEMIEWGLSQVLASFESRVMTRLVAQCEGDARLRAVPPELTAVILAGNVFTAPLREVALPLVARSPVLAKVPVQGAALLSAFVDALDAEDEALADHVGVVVFGRDDREAGAALLRCAEVVSVYGDDRTVAAIRRQAPAGARVVEHGHGMSAVYVPRGAQQHPDQVRPLARRVATDVIAYDQLGCLSPQMVFVQHGGCVDPAAFARALHEAIDELGRWLPRGVVPSEAAAAIAQWRGVAAARGTLFQSATHACSAEQGAPRVGPGYRHVGVYGCSGVGALGRALQPWGRQVKCLGVAGSVAERTDVALALPPGLSPRVCAAGTMQTPPLDAYFDGLPPFAGLLGFVQIG